MINRVSVEDAITRLNAALTAGGGRAAQEKALYDAAVIARRVLLTVTQTLANEVPVVETVTENRIQYSYGVNSPRTHRGNASFEDLQETVEYITKGRVDVDKRESRTVSYTAWVESK